MSCINFAKKRLLFHKLNSQNIQNPHAVSTGNYGIQKFKDMHKNYQSQRKFIQHELYIVDMLFDTVS
jgi:hypothetical protein